MYRLLTVKCKLRERACLCVCVYCWQKSDFPWSDTSSSSFVDSERNSISTILVKIKNKRDNTSSLSHWWGNLIFREKIFLSPLSISKLFCILREDWPTSPMLLVCIWCYGFSMTVSILSSLHISARGESLLSLKRIFAPEHIDLHYSLLF